MLVSMCNYVKVSNMVLKDLSFDFLCNNKHAKPRRTQFVETNYEELRLFSFNLIYPRI